MKYLRMPGMGLITALLGTALVAAQEANPDAARDREIFWLHHRQGFTAAAIAAIPGCEIGTKGVESVLQRLRCNVRRRLAEKGRSGSMPQPCNEGIPPENPFNEEEGQL